MLWEAAHELTPYQSNLEGGFDRQPSAQFAKNGVDNGIVPKGSTGTLKILRKLRGDYGISGSMHGRSAQGFHAALSALPTMMAPIRVWRFAVHELELTFAESWVCESTMSNMITKIRRPAAPPLG